MAIANGTCVGFCNQPKAHFGLHGYAPGTIAVNVTWMKRGFNACQTHCSIYPSIFNRLRAIARYWSQIATFSYPLHLTTPLGRSHWNSGKSLYLRKLESWIHGATRQWRQFDDRLSRFDTIPACDGRTERRTIKCAVWLTHANKRLYTCISVSHSESAPSHHGIVTSVWWHPAFLWRAPVKPGFHSNSIACVACVA